MLELIGKHASHFHLHLVYIAHQEADFFVARERQQRAIAEKGERLAVWDYLDGGGVGLARDIAAGALHAVLDPQENVAAHGRIEFEPVRGFGAAIGGHVSERKGLRPGENVIPDLAFLAPVAGILVLLGLIGVAHGKQVGLNLAGECPLRHGRRAGEQQDLFGLIAGVIHQGHLRAAKAEAGAAGDDHIGFEPLAGLIASPRRPDAFSYRDGDGGVVARHSEGGRTDVSRELELVISHGEVLAIGGKPEEFRVLGGDERDVLLELGGVYRVTEAYRGHQVLGGRVLRILIELAADDFGGERLGLELEAVVVKLHGLGEEPPARDFDGKGGVHRPV